jgi:hypothetical protein
LAVKAFGEPNAYNRFIFAENLPEKIKLDLIWAGEGTLWTSNGDVGIRAYVPVDQGQQEKDKGALPLTPAQTTQQTDTQ